MKKPKNLSVSASRTARATCLGAVALAVLAGCASLATGRMEQAARQRAEQRWQFLVQRNYEAAWGMHAPGWRALNPYEAWRVGVGSGVEWFGARATAATCEATPAPRCTVELAVTARPTGLPIKDIPRDSPVTEVWIEQDGQWWMVPAAQ